MRARRTRPSPLLPAGVLCAQIGDDDSPDDMHTQNPRTEAERDQLSRAHALHKIVKARVTHRLPVAGPAPISGDKGPGGEADKLRQSQDRAGKWQLQPDEIDTEERGVFGRTAEAGNSKANEGHRRIR